MNDTFLLFHLFFIKPVIPALIEQPLTLLLTQVRRKAKQNTVALFLHLVGP